MYLTETAIDATLRCISKHPRWSEAVSVNKVLMKDCLSKSRETLNEVDAATVIIRELWNRLRETHRLRVVK